MSWTRLRTIGGWASLTTVAPGEFEAIDTRIASTIDVVGGGSYAPSAPVTIGGSGVRLTSLFYSDGGAQFSQAAAFYLPGLTIDDTGTYAGGDSDVKFSCTLPAWFTGAVDINAALTGVGATFVSYTASHKGVAIGSTTTTIGTNVATVTSALPVTITADLTAQNVTGTNASFSGTLTAVGTTTLGDIASPGGTANLGTVTLHARENAMDGIDVTGGDVNILAGALIAHQRIQTVGEARITPRLVYLTDGDQTVDIVAGSLFTMKGTSTGDHSVKVNTTGAVVGDVIEFQNYSTAHVIALQDFAGSQFGSVPAGSASGYGGGFLAKPGTATVQYVDDGVTAGPRWQWVGA